jgi:hypothetical protein
MLKLNLNHTNQHISPSGQAEEYYKSNPTTVNVELSYKDIFDNKFEKKQAIEIKTSNNNNSSSTVQRIIDPAYDFKWSLR